MPAQNTGKVGANSYAITEMNRDPTKASNMTIWKIPINPFEHKIYANLFSGLIRLNRPASEFMGFKH